MVGCLDSPKAALLVLGLLCSPGAADHALGGYAGVKYDSVTYSGNDHVLYRGHKDFIVYKHNGVDHPRILIRRLDAASKDTLRATLYRLRDLLQDPGTEKSSVSQIAPADSHAFTFHLPEFDQGLYRLRIEPNRNHVSYRVTIEDIQFFAQEAWEPRYNFYMLGKDNDPPVERFFFIPGEAGMVKVRLQTEKGLERARVQVYQITPTEQLRLTVQVHGDSASGDAPAYFASATFRAAEGDHRRPSGQLYKFVVTDPSEPLEQGKGNIWVRFSRNVPPYFADDWRRLLLPIVHRMFDPVLYEGASATYRAYLTLDRGSPGIGARDTLQLRVGGSTQTTATGYMDSVRFTASRRGKIGDLVARLKNDRFIVARSTDKVDTVYVVQEPTWNAWDDPLYVMYDDWDGRHNAAVAQATNYRTVQCSNVASFRAHFSTRVQAMGVLYSGNMQSVFDANADSDSIRFWNLRDEPDSGPGPNGAMSRLRAVYGDYYARKNQSTSKMLAMNFMHAFPLEEYAEGADLIITDPYVKSESGNSRNRIRDWIGALQDVSSGPNSQKRTIVVLWAWGARGDPATLIDPVGLYGSEWEMLYRHPVVDGIATYKWGNPHFAIQQLSAFPNGSALWDSITTKWSAFRAQVPKGRVR